ncbi:MAG TPA: hypothetical protein VNO50_02970, partial [Pyrinomonadaceae bacterium]|nr:hypothetical protein [Pyrinomonadaceae bacterium]
MSNPPVLIGDFNHNLAADGKQTEQQWFAEIRSKDYEGNKKSARRNVGHCKLKLIIFQTPFLSLDDNHFIQGDAATPCRKMDARIVAPTI